MRLIYISSIIGIFFISRTRDYCGYGVQAAGSLFPTIEKSIFETFPDDESVADYDSLFQLVLNNGETIYYRFDPQLPIFYRLANDLGRQVVVLDQDEAHLHHTDEKTKIVLRQKWLDPNVYTVHMALIRYVNIYR